jgi:Transcriptional regulator, AbiEi antitoxin
MTSESPIAVVTRLAASSSGAFRGRAAIEAGVSRTELGTLSEHGAIERVFPDTYRLTAAPRSHEQLLRAALLWAGDGAAAAARSAGIMYGLEGVRAELPEIVVEHGRRLVTQHALVRHCRDRRSLMIRQVRGIAVTGVEATLLALAHELDEAALEVACEDARRRRLTSVPALRAYLDRFGKQGRPGVAAMRRLLGELDPKHPARSTLEVKTRRLLVAHGITGFVREFPLDWNGRTYCFDFAFPGATTILETKGRRWHDDPSDYEHDHEKWSVPGRHGYRLVLATWDKVTHHPDALVAELLATLAAPWERLAR